mmetsp:Transcript_34527/g.84916  ORF Transcript_34527/g.84916 Transcript_34527/m.84916 type:complete len:234 (-) Transcript_34527:419-1120(-)
MVLRSTSGPWVCWCSLCCAVTTRSTTRASPLCSEILRRAGMSSRRLIGMGSASTPSSLFGKCSTRTRRSGRRRCSASTTRGSATPARARPTSCTARTGPSCSSRRCPSSSAWRPAACRRCRGASRSSGSTRKRCCSRRGRRATACTSSTRASPRCSSTAWRSTASASAASSARLPWCSPANGLPLSSRLGRTRTPGTTQRRPSFSNCRAPTSRRSSRSTPYSSRASTPSPRTT